jgi:hypothetical protein
MLVHAVATSATRRAQPLSRPAAVVFVSGVDDFARSGPGSLPEVLHRAHGVHLARLASRRVCSSWRRPRRAAPARAQRTTFLRL